MDYKEAIKYIKDTAAFGSKLGLDNIRSLMQVLGSPQEKLDMIHIAGTNGKGSVAAYMLSALKTAGYRIGFYTSPELFRFSERIRINDDEISEDDIAYYATKVRDAAAYMARHGIGSPTEFEIVLAMAFCYFLDRGVDAVILETGLGGRLDATNVISHSLLSVITKISYDHMQYLGNTLPEIAYEKAAIIKPRGRVLVYPAEDEIMRVFEDRCRCQDAKLHIAKLPVSGTASLRAGQTFTLSGRTYITRMAGLYERDNAALAIQALELIKGPRLKGLTDDAIYDGISKAFWPGRFEILNHDPYVIVDGAHNEDGARALSAALSEYFGEQKLTLCIGILKDKQYTRMLSHLLPHAGNVIACEVPNPRSLTSKELADAVREISSDMPLFITDFPESALRQIKKLQYSTAAVVICGSLYLAGPLRELYLHE